MTGYTRRAFVAGTAGLGLAVALDACSSSPHTSPYFGELRTVGLAAAMENQLVSAYKTIEAALSAGKLGTGAPALSAFVTAALAHHVQHAKTWNAILTASHAPTISGTPLSGSSKVKSQIQAVSSADAAVAALRRLEDQAAQTHTAGVAGLTNIPAAVSAAAGIAPVEAMHAAALGYLFGGGSSVSEFIGTSGALSVKELTL